MSGISAGGAIGGGGAARLVQDLEEIARGTSAAAQLAQGDYINPPSVHDLHVAEHVAGAARSRLELLLPEIDAHGAGGGTDLARTAVEHLDAGRDAIRWDLAPADDLGGHGGPAVVDQVSTGAAGAFLEHAAFAVQGLAAGVTLHATPLDQLAAHVTRATP